MKNEVLKWEIKKVFEGNKKVIWVTSILIYILLIFTQNYTLNNQTLQESYVEEIMHIMKKVLYGGMSLYNVALVIAVVSPLFAQEYDSNMYDTIRASKYGHQFIVRIKLEAALTAVLAYTMIYNGFNYIFFSFFLKWNALSCLNKYWKMGILSQIFGNLAIMGICCLISAMTKNIFSSITISGFIIFLPIFIPDTGLQKYLKYFPIWSVQLETCEEIDKLVLIFIIDIVIAIVSIFLTRRKKLKWI